MNEIQIKMKVKFEVCAFVALLLAINVNCIRVIDNKEESLTTENNKETETTQESLESQTTIKPAESLVEIEPRNIENDYNHVTTSSTTTTAATTNIIPPTLLNAKHEINTNVTEKPGKVLKDLV